MPKISMTSKVKEHIGFHYHNIFRMQFDGSIMCRFYNIALIEYITLLDYTNLFSPSDGKKN